MQLGKERDPLVLLSDLDAMVEVAKASDLFSKFKDAYSKNDLATASSVLPQLKLALVQLPSLPPAFEQSSGAAEELALARDVLEHAVLLSLKQKNESAMERSFAQLKTYYSDTKGRLPPSDMEYPMLGINLLRLLVQNRIAEFHTELELVPTEGLSSPYVQHAVMLEQWLMEGAYNKVLEAGKQVPSEFHGFLLDQLASTVRDEIVSCSEKAYTRLRLADAQKLMMFDSQEALTAYANEHDWSVSDGYIHFQQQDALGSKALPSLGLINNTLVYAKELERIV